MDVCSGSLFSLVLMSTVFSSRLRLLTYVSPSDNCIEIEAGIARTLQFPVLKCVCKLVMHQVSEAWVFGFFWKCRAIRASISIQLSKGDTYLRRRNQDENTVLINTKENKEPGRYSLWY